jgi:hypothetical protein
LGYVGSVFHQFGIVVYANAVAELDGQEDGMLHLMPDVWSSDVVVETLRVILYHDLALTLAFILALYELLLDVVVTERFNK